MSVAFKQFTNEEVTSAVHQGVAAGLQTNNRRKEKDLLVVNRAPRGQMDVIQLDKKKRNKKKRTTTKASTSQLLKRIKPLQKINKPHDF